MKNVNVIAKLHARAQEAEMLGYKLLAGMLRARIAQLRAQAEDANEAAG